jgi:TonB family protein
MKRRQLLSFICIAWIYACSSSETPDTVVYQEHFSNESPQLELTFLTDTFKVRRRTGSAVVSLDTFRTTPPTTVSGNEVIEIQPDVPPQFNGGDAALRAYLKKKCVYPLVAFQNEVSGVVTISFRICADGSIEGIKVKRSVGFGCDEMAVGVVKNMPNWIPGTKSGKNVKCPVALDVPCGR